MTALIEVTFAYLLKNAKGHDAKSFYTRPAFAEHPTPTIELTSPDCGPNDSRLAVDYTYDGTGRFPELQWSAPEDVRAKTKEWLLVSEDPDAPLPTPNLHGWVGTPSNSRTGSCC
jgi:phosphatidylethanolamine-binding protein (PEBP) family uncharacterized protein